MKRILVVYYSLSGHTEFVAQQLAAQCQADLEPIKDRHSRRGALGYLRSVLEALFGGRPAIERARRRPGNYDLVILGTPVWAWNVASPLRTWLERHRNELKHVALFCTCGGSGHAKVLNDLERLCGHAAQARLVMTERAIGQCQSDPAFRRFLQDIGREPPSRSSLPSTPDQATA